MLRALVDRCSAPPHSPAARFEKDLSSMTRKRNPKIENGATGTRRTSGDAMKKRPSWTRRILILLGRQFLNGSGRLQHRYVVPPGNGRPLYLPLS